jgi:hypothetical protein
MMALSIKSGKPGHVAAHGQLGANFELYHARSLKGELEDAKINHDILRKKSGSSEAQDGEDNLSGKPSFLLNEIETLRKKVEASQIRVHDLEQELLEANADQEELEFLRKVRAQGKSSMLA